MLQGEKIDPKEIDAMLRNLRELSDDRVYKNADELARLQAQVTDSAKRLDTTCGAGRRHRRAAPALGLRRSREVPQERRAILPVAVEGSRRGQGTGDREAASEEAVADRDGHESCAVITAGLVALTLAAGVSAQDYFQFQRRFRQAPKFATDDSFDGSFTFCRLFIPASAAGMAARGGGPTIRTPTPTS
jgi:hypothetical protein